jgi:hypothetical protein
MYYIITIINVPGYVHSQYIQRCDMMFTISLNLLKSNKILY